MRAFDLYEGNGNGSVRLEGIDNLDVNGARDVQRKASMLAVSTSKSKPQRRTGIGAVLQSQEQSRIFCLFGPQIHQLGCWLSPTLVTQESLRSWRSSVTAKGSVHLRSSRLISKHFLGKLGSQQLEFKLHKRVTSYAVLGVTSRVTRIRFVCENRGQNLS